MGLVASVRELWRYPVKSMQGEALDGAVVDQRGAAGDRRWAVDDVETNRVASAKQPKLWLTMLQCAAADFDEPSFAAKPPTGTDHAAEWP